MVAVVLAGGLLLSTLWLPARDHNAEELLPVAQQVIEARNQVLVHGAPAAELDASTIAAELFAEERAVHAALVEQHRSSTAAGLQYSGTSTELTLHSVQREAGRRTLVVNEHSTLLFAHPAVDIDSPVSTEWSVEREFGFVLIDGSWWLTSHRLLSEGAPPENEPWGGPLHPRSDCSCACVNFWD